MKQTQDISAAASGGCPMAGLSATTEADRGGLLLTAGQVEELAARIMPLASVVDWMRAFLACSHPELGRGGPVCPFVPQALELGTIWLTAVPVTGGDRETIAAAVARYRELFLDLEPKAGEGALNKAILLVFPYLDQAAAPPLIDEVQRELKPRFVEAGLMIGEFHALNESPGLRNPAFRPLRSPMPMIAIRHMVGSDLPFLRRDADSPAVRSDYVRSYLRRLGTAISRAHFEAAVDALVEAEIERRLAAPLAQAPISA